MKKRLLKKKLGKLYHKVQLGKKLKVGDLVSTCRGYNERIKIIEPEIFNSKTNKSFVWDYHIETTSGGNCSLRHCITFPLETKEQIVERWKRYNTPEGKKFAKEWLSEKSQRLINMISDGEEVFTETGELK